MIKHMKVDDAFNYSLYKQLDFSLKYKRYELRLTYTGYVTNIGSYDRQYPYKETDFYHFDEFLFTTEEISLMVKARTKYRGVLNFDCCDALIAKHSKLKRL